LITSLSLALLAGGCADTYTGARLFSVQNQYDHLTCEQLAANIRASETRVKELKALITKAERDAGGSLIGNSVYQPQLLQTQADLTIYRETLERRRECPQV
jgi:hypothetical protein